MVVSGKPSQGHNLDVGCYGIREGMLWLMWAGEGEPRQKGRAGYEHMPDAREQVQDDEHAASTAGRQRMEPSLEPAAKAVTHTQEMQLCPRKEDH